MLLAVVASSCGGEDNRPQRAGPRVDQGPVRGAGETTTTLEGDATEGIAPGGAPTTAPPASTPDAPAPQSPFKTHGCLGYVTPTTPARGWYPPQGSTTDVSLKGADRAERSPALERLVKVVDAELPDPYDKEGTGEIKQEKCALRRTVVLRDPETGARFVATWEQMKESRSRETVPHTGPLTWRSRTDGGAVATDGADPSVHGVLLVVGDGRSVYVISAGRRSNHLNGYPQPTTQKGPVDPAPLSIDQLLPIAERLIGAQQV